MTFVLLNSLEISQGCKNKLLVAIRIIASSLLLLYVRTAMV